MLGQCVKRNDLTYIVTKEMRMCSKTIYQLIGYDPKGKIHFDSVSIEPEKITEKVVCENFVSFKNLYNYLFDLINFKKVKLLALMFDYGDNWYDDQSEDELAQYILLYCHGKIIQMAIPIGVEYTSNTYQIPFVHISEITKENLEEVKNHSEYYFLNEDAYLEEITFKNLDEFFTNNEFYIKAHEIKEFQGIKINDIILANFDEDTVISIGNGIICDLEKYYEKEELYKEDFANKLKKILEG